MEADEPLECRCRGAYVVGEFVGAALGFTAGWYFTSALITSGALPGLYGELRIAVFALAGWVLGTASMIAGLTFAVAPVLRADGGRLYWRRAFRRRETSFDAAELRWRAGAAVVGRFLLTSRDGGEHKIPIAWLRPNDLRRLCAWLDRHAVESPRRPAQPVAEGARRPIA